MCEVDRLRNSPAEMYKEYLILITLVKLDFAMAIVLIAQHMALVLEPDDPEFALNVLAVLVVVAFVLVLWFGVLGRARIFAF